MAATSAGASCRGGSARAPITAARCRSPPSSWQRAGSAGPVGGPVVGVVEVVVVVVVVVVPVVVVVVVVVVPVVVVVVVPVVVVVVVPVVVVVVLGGGVDGFPERGRRGAG